MGWLLMLGLALLAALGLWRFGRIRGPALQMVAAVLFLAAAGYAWQGNPSLAGKPARPVIAPVEMDTAFTSLRHAILGRFNRADQWMTIADSYLRRGDTQNAVDVLRSGIRARPEDPRLWIGLGNALVEHAGGMMTPAAELAFDRATRLSPGNPAPRFFYGLSLVRGGRLADAETAWRQVVAEAPPKLAWRDEVVVRLRLLERIRAMIEEGASAPPTP
jgi:cytochrome c-type biogenesis protein CcmH/NrfG